MCFGVNILIDKLCFDSERDGVMNKIFISYSSDDKTPIQEVVGDLKSLSYSVWFDSELVGGQSWWDRILREIENADFYLCALSSAYLKSDACKRELSYANKLGKTIIPIKISNDFDERFLPLEISKLQITDVEAGNKKGVLSLINALNTAEPSPVLPDPMPESPAIPVSYLSELLRDINSREPLDQDQQAALMFKLRDHFRSGGDSKGVSQALDKLEARKDLLANIGREVDTLRKEIASKAESSPETEKPRPEPVSRKRNSVNNIKAEINEAIETGKTDKSALGFGILAFIIPFVGLILFFVWRNSQPQRAKVIMWSAIAGFVFFAALLSESDTGYYY